MSDKRLYSRVELGDIYGISAQTVANYIAAVPFAAKDNKTHLWNLSDVTELTDQRPKKELKEGAWENQWGSHDPDNDHIETDPNKMKAAERRLHWQGEDLRQSTLLKERKNAVEARELIPAHEVELTLAGAFKAVTLMLDTLPDALERDGVIPPGDINKVISILDSAREQLNNDLLESEMNPVTDLIKMMVGGK